MGTNDKQHTTLSDHEKTRYTGVRLRSQGVGCTTMKTAMICSTRERCWLPTNLVVQMSKFLFTITQPRAVLFVIQVQVHNRQFNIYETLSHHVIEQEDKNHWTKNHSRHFHLYVKKF